MFHKLRSYFNKHTWQIFIGILVLAFFFIILQFLNSIYKEPEKSPMNQVENIITNNSKNIVENTITNQEQETLVTTEITRDNVIERFVQYCNNKQMEKAYDLIADECKQLLFPNIEVFKTNYYNIIFTQKRSYSAEEWEKNTGIYRVRYTNDIMADGKVADNQYEDYIKIASTTKGIRLNINSFIGTINIGKKAEREGLAIEVIKKDMYMNYETYTIKIRNTASNLVEFTELTNNSINISDKMGNKYGAYIHELPLEYFTLNAGQERNIVMKFNKVYNNNRVITRMNFESIKVKKEQEEINIAIYIGI